ncbi:MAG: DUF1257 domain-containing protein [Chloroflexota bacterium]|nr:DUF1257 domain-containing protein [Chloroflexota bacterium]
MAEFSAIPTLFTSVPIIVAALADLGLSHLETRESSLRDEEGLQHAQTAELIVRHEHNAGASLDLGFKRGSDRFFLLIVSTQDQTTYAGQWLQKLNQRYNYHIAVRRLQEHGYGLVESDQTQNRIAPTVTSLEALQPHGFLDSLLHLVAPNLVKRHNIEELARSPQTSRTATTLAEVIAYFNHQPSREIALQALKKLTEPRCINQVCRVWVTTRHPDLSTLLIEQGWVATTPTILKVLTALKTDRIARLADLEAKDVTILLQACSDTEPDIAEGAKAYLREMQSPALLVGLCETWVAQRDPILLEYIQNKQGLPTQINTRVLVALKLGRWEVIANDNAIIVAPLIEACSDSDPAIATAARQTLTQLKKPAAQQALCNLVIEQGLSLAQQIALEAGYVPSEVYRRVLFFFLTEQWERYETLDFDHSLLRAAYETARPPLRRRLVEKMRVAGRSDYLKAIIDLGRQSSLPQISPEEAELVVQILTNNREWARLWPLVLEMNLAWSNRIIHLLVQANWQPERADERALFEQLKLLTAERLNYGELEINSQSLPLALLRARAKVSGRINTLAFSPTRPVVAIGTGTGKVVLWNLQKAEREQVLSGFEHSVGRVTFTREAKLVCAERTNTEDGLCNLYTWAGEGQQLILLGQHKGSITALEAVGENSVLSAGRDHKIALWDVTTQTLAKAEKLNNWVRSACVSSNGQQVALLYDRRLIVATLPQLQIISQNSIGTLGVARSSVFAPDEKALLASKFNGGLGLCLNKNLRWWTPSELLGNLSEITGQVQGLATLTRLNIVLAATADGLIHFIDWSKGGKLLGQVKAPSERLTSLTVSPNGAFMAVGDSDASFTLWDLRVLELHQLLELPLSQAKPNQLAALTAVLGSGAELTPSLKLILRFAESVLHHRFRYAIELTEELPLIQAGEFDIEIDG